MAGALYVHVSDSRRFLLVGADRRFPSAFIPAEWRLVAIGVEPMTAAARVSLRTRGFFEYRSPAIVNL